MKNIFSYILFFISAASFQSQVTLIAKPDMRDLRADQKLTLTVVLELQGSDFSIQSPVKMPDLSKFEMIGNASESRTDLTTRTKTLVYQFVLQPKQTGRIKVGSVLYDVNDKIYKTEPFDIFVTDSDLKKVAVKADEDDYVYLNLEVKDRNIYKNQPTVAVLKAYSKNFDNFRKVSRVKLPTNGLVNFREVDFKKSDIEQSNSSKMASQVIAVFVISTPESGKVEIPAVSAVMRNSSENITLKSNKVNLIVKKLPANSPLHYKNAVGDFKVDLNSDAEEINTLGKPINLNIKISGEGNFRTMVLPKLAISNDYSFFKPKIIYKTKSSDKGSVGHVNLHYIIIPKKEGKINIKTEQFSYFNPDTDTYENLKPDTLSFNALSEVSINDSKSALDKVNEYTSNVLLTVKAPKIISDHLGISEKPQLNYKIIAGNLVLLCGLVFLIFSYRKKKKIKKSAVLKNTSKIENIAETEDKIKDTLHPDIESELEYLEKLKLKGDYNSFFTAYENLNNDLERFIKNKYQLTFKTFLIKNKGSKFAEDIRDLNEEIAMERFSPFHTPETVDAILIKIKNLFQDII